MGWKRAAWLQRERSVSNIQKEPAMGSAVGVGTGAKVGAAMGIEVGTGMGIEVGEEIA